MRRHDDEIVECPFDKSHKMPYPRLQWHLANKCKAKIAREQMGLPILRCQFNFLHVFFEDSELASHEATCTSKPKAKDVAEKNEWHIAKSASDVQGVVDSIWNNPHSDLLKTVQSKTVPVISGRSWDSTTAEEEKSSEWNMEQKISERDHQEQKQRKESSPYTMLKIFLVWVMSALACTLLYAMVQSLDQSPEMASQTTDVECEAIHEPILVALNGMI